MVDFSDLLKGTLESINKAFREVESDLSDVSSRISTAVKTNVGGQFDIIKSEVRNTIDGVVYRFYFDTNVNDDTADAVTLCFIRLPVTGYPIFAGKYNYKDKIFSPQEELSDKQELELYFERFFDNPESALIQAIGFALRKNRTAE